jgi:hypothetical protein
MKTESKLKSQTYYKYRSLEDFECFLDIIVRQRLYGATNRELNDPMEGKFNREGLIKDDFESIHKTLGITRICSLLTKQDTKTFPDDYLMWSHYADSHKGCCIEVEITDRYNQEWSLIEVEYTNQLPLLHEKQINDRIHHILSVKAPIWHDENEVRAIRIYDDKEKFGSQSPYYYVKVKAVYFGCRINKEKRDFYKKIISKINPKIDLYYLKEETTSPSFFPTLEPIPLFINGKTFLVEYLNYLIDHNDDDS